MIPNARPASGRSDPPYERSAIVDQPRDAPLLGSAVTPDGQWAEIPVDATVDIDQWAVATATTVLARRSRSATGTELDSIAAAWRATGEEVRRRTRHPELAAGIVAALAHVPDGQFTPIAVADVVAVQLPWLPEVTEGIDSQIEGVLEEIRRSEGSPDVDGLDVRVLGQVFSVDLDSVHGIFGVRAGESELARDLAYQRVYLWRLSGPASYAAMLIAPYGDDGSACLGQRSEAFDDLARTLELRLSHPRKLSLPTLVSLYRAAEARSPAQDARVHISDAEYFRRWPGSPKQQARPPEQQMLDRWDRPLPSWGQRWAGMGRTLIPIFGIALVLGIGSYRFAEYTLDQDGFALQGIAGLSLIFGCLGVGVGCIFWLVANVLAPTEFFRDRGLRALPVAAIALGTVLLGVFAGTAPVLLGGGGSLF